MASRAHAPTPLTLLLVLVLAAATAPVVASAGQIVDNVPFPVITRSANLTLYRAFLVERFGFAPGGTAKMVIDVTASDGRLRSGPANGTLTLAVCTAKEFAQMLPAGDLLPSPNQVVPGFCGWTVPTSCTRVPLHVHLPRFGPGGGTLRYSREFTEEKVYYFILEACGAPVSVLGTDLEATAKLTMFNPGLGYISTTDAPHIGMFITCVAVWALFLVAWIGVVFMNRGEHVALHVVLTLIPVIKLLPLLTEYWAWKSRAAGITNTEFGSRWEPAVSTVRILYRGVFFVVLLFVAKGWLVTRRRIPRGEQRSLYATVTLYSVGHFVFKIWGSVGSVALLSALVTTVTFVLLVYSVWHSARVNINVLANAVFWPHLGRVVQGHVWTKHGMFRTLRNAYVIYLFAEAAADVMSRSPVFVESIPWVPLAADEIVEFIFWATLSVAFRPRLSGRNIFLSRRPPQPTSPTASVAVGTPRDPNAITDHPSVYVVLNPDGHPALGFKHKPDPPAGLPSNASVTSQRRQTAIDRLNLSEQRRVERRLQRQLRRQGRRTAPRAPPRTYSGRSLHSLSRHGGSHHSLSSRSLRQGVSLRGVELVTVVSDASGSGRFSDGRRGYTSSPGGHRNVGSDGDEAAVVQVVTIGDADWDEGEILAAYDALPQRRDSPGGRFVFGGIPHAGAGYPADVAAVIAAAAAVEPHGLEGGGRAAVDEEHAGRQGVGAGAGAGAGAGDGGSGVDDGTGSGSHAMRHPGGGAGGRGGLDHRNRADAGAGAGGGTPAGSVAFDSREARFADAAMASARSTDGLLGSGPGGLAAGDSSDTSDEAVRGGGGGAAASAGGLGMPHPVVTSASLRELLMSSDSEADDDGAGPAQQRRTSPPLSPTAGDVEVLSARPAVDLRPPSNSSSRSLTGSRRSLGSNSDRPASRRSPDLV